MYYLKDIQRIPTTAEVLIHPVLGTLAIIAVVAAYLSTRRKANSVDCLFWITGSLAITYLALGIKAGSPDDVHPFVYGYLVFISSVSAFGCVLCWIRLGLPLDNEQNNKATGSQIAAAIACVIILNFVIASLLQPVSSARNAAYRTQCKNNLKQLGLAFHNYESRQGEFPASANSDPPFSWRVAILPYVDQSPLFEKYVFSLGWDSAENEFIAKTQVSVFQCPSRKRLNDGSLMHDSRGRFYAHYTMITGPGTVGRGVKIRDIADGTSNTLLVFEACGLNLVWTDPIDMNTSVQPEGINLPSPKRGMSPGWVSSHHIGGGHVLLADGSVRYISENIDRGTLKSLTTIDADDRIGDY